MMLPDKATTSLTMPVYGMGTWQMGGRNERNIDNDDAADIAALHQALELGVTHFDTAEQYAAGYSETLLGRAIAGANRAGLFLVSKVLPVNQRPEYLLRSFDRTTERMGVDYLDMYMLHRFASDVPLDETMDAMGRLVDNGSVRHLAVSNFSVDRMQRAQAASKHKIVANQLHYNVQVREPEHSGLLAHCQNNDVMLIAWGPVQKGELDTNAAVLNELAGNYGCTPTQVAVNWLVSQPNVVTLSKTRSLSHLSENVKACNWQMDARDVERIRKEMPNQSPVSNRVPLDYP